MPIWPAYKNSLTDLPPPRQPTPRQPTPLHISSSPQLSIPLLTPYGSDPTYFQKPLLHLGHVKQRRNCWMAQIWFEEGNISPPSSPTPGWFAEHNASLSGTSPHPWAEPTKQTQNNEASPIIPEPPCIDPRDLTNDSNSATVIPASNAIPIMPRPKTPKK